MLKDIAVAPALSDRELAAWRGMLEVHAEVTRELDAQMRAAHGLAISAYEVLMFLGESPDGRMRMSDLAHRVLLSRSGCTRLVDRVVQLGYVTRCADSSDGRGLHAEITDAGSETLTAARSTARDGIRGFFLSRLTPHDLDALGDIWTRLGQTGVGHLPGRGALGSPRDRA
jgi:DNA-binding MarR family transcriptional regulator